MRAKYLVGLLEPSDMFRDDLWWNMPEEPLPAEILVSQRRIEVEPPKNPMVLKAEQIFREALNK